MIYSAYKSNRTDFICGLAFIFTVIVLFFGGLKWIWELVQEMGI